MKTICAAVGLAGVLMAGTANAGLLGGPGSPIYSSFTTAIPDSAGTVLNVDFPVKIATPPPRGVAGSPLAQEFNVTSTTDLTAIWLRLSDSAPTDGGSILVYLVPDNGGTPSSNGTTMSPTLASNKVLLGTIFDSALPTNGANGCVFGGANPTIPTINACNTELSVNDVVPSGEYWIALVDGADTANGGSNTIDSSAVWWRAGDTVGLNTANQDNAHVNTSGMLTPQTPISQDFELQVNAAPEPISVALLGTGLAGLGFVRRRRNRKSAG